MKIDKKMNILELTSHCISQHFKIRLFHSINQSPKMSTIVNCIKYYIPKNIIITNLS